MSRDFYPLTIKFPEPRTMSGTWKILEKICGMNEEQLDEWMGGCVHKCPLLLLLDPIRLPLGSQHSCCHRLFLSLPLQTLRSTGLCVEPLNAPAFEPSFPVFFLL